MGTIYKYSEEKHPYRRMSDKEYHALKEKYPTTFLGSAYLHKEGYREVFCNPSLGINEYIYIDDYLDRLKERVDIKIGDVLKKIGYS